MGNGSSKKKNSMRKASTTTSNQTNYSATTNTSSSTSSGQTAIDVKNEPVKDELESLFEKYQAIDSHEGESEKDRDYIGGEGIIKLAEDIGIDPMDIATLIMTFKLNAKEQYKISHAEFNNFKKYGITNLSQMRQIVPQWKIQIQNDKTQYKALYTYAFDYMRDPGQKCMLVDIAVPTWKMLLSDRYKYTNEWCDFIENDYKKAIQKDTWNLFYDFVQAVGDNLSLYSEDQAWPIAIDSFVENLKKSKKC